jgi:DNA-binding protein, histone-like, putative
MSQNFKLVERYSKVGDKDSAKKYYAMAKSNGFTDFEHLCKMITERSMASSADVKGILDNLNFVIDLELQAGRIVQLGELGNFRMTIGSDGAEEESAFKKSMLRKPKIVFFPGKALQSTRVTTKFTKVKDSAEEDSKEDTEPLGDL